MSAWSQRIEYAIPQLTKVQSRENPFVEEDDTGAEGNPDSREGIDVSVVAGSIEVQDDVSGALTLRRRQDEALPLAAPSSRSQDSRWVRLGLSAS